MKSIRLLRMYSSHSIKLPIASNLDKKDRRAVAVLKEGTPSTNETLECLDEGNSEIAIISESQMSCTSLILETVGTL